MIKADMYCMCASQYKGRMRVFMAILLVSFIFFPIFDMGKMRIKRYLTGCSLDLECPTRVRVLRFSPKLGAVGRW